ncbi:hypothetical protein LCGC14_3001450 [marine sediment metagenome]|uniref:Uncharacterized protein n=1 Tax=marine sediment metagenome TaxID=412755 RepID=A0A0F8ZS09_9ZZZZ
MNLYVWALVDKTRARGHIDDDYGVYILVELDMYTNDDAREYTIGWYSSVAGAKNAWRRSWGAGYQWYPKCRGCGYARTAGHVCDSSKTS